MNNLQYKYAEQKNYLVLKTEDNIQIIRKKKRSILRVWTIARISIKPFMILTELREVLLNKPQQKNIYLKQSIFKKRETEKCLQPIN